MSKALDPSSIANCTCPLAWVPIAFLAAPRQNEPAAPFRDFYHHDMADFNQHTAGRETNSQDYNVAKVLVTS